MIIIPDVHGRKFWREAVKGHEDEKIIFLGDYTDPYTNYDGITKEECLKELKAIISFKKKHNDNVILLIGNHDLSYICDTAAKCRFDFENWNEIKKLFIKNKELFQLTYSIVVNGTNYLFSHSGIIPKWYRWHEGNEKLETIKTEDIPETLNRMFQEDMEHVCYWLSDVSPDRGGSEFRHSGFGSCVWGGLAEIYSYLKNKASENFRSTFQVFGHTQLKENPVVERYFACLDVRRGFILNEHTGEITELDGKIVKPKMKDILVIGSDGQLGQEIKNWYKVYDINNNYHFTSHSGDNPLDITDYDAIERYIGGANIDYIINCAAYTNVDGAEDNYEAAYAVNCTGVKNLARICKERDIKLVHISTDYVFSGEGTKPYKPTDETNPINKYGETKLLGEQAIREIGCDALIIRTSWLYSTYGKNFVKKMIELFETMETVKVVDDQKGSPTNAFDLAQFIMKILSDGKFKSGTVQFSNIGETTWFEFASKIYELSGGVYYRNNFTCKEILPCKTEEFPTKAKRPRYSVMDTSLIKELFDYKIPKWQDSLQQSLLYMYTFNYL